MKLGFGLYRHMLDRDHLRFAKQCGATHVVVHLVDYFNQAGGHSDQPVAGGRGGGWGVAGNPATLWQEDELREIKALIESERLSWFAIENFDPAHWYDVLLDGPSKERQLDGLRQMIGAIGRVGIPVLGYNFCLGTLAEIPRIDIYELTKSFAREGRIAYVHCRNVRGHAPDYREVFLDEGDIDIARILHILREENFQGVIIPDHAPQMHCAAPWHSGMAFAMGYLKALLG